MKFIRIHSEGPGNITPGRVPQTNGSATIKKSPHATAESHSFRMEVLVQLHSMGSGTSRRHGFDFFLYLPSETAACAAAAKIRENEFTAEVLAGIADGKWRCRAGKTFVPESAPPDEIAQFLNQMATAFQGQFDGWESDVVKPPQSS